jgi:hypothetical protein
MAFVRVKRTFRTGVSYRIENFGDRDGGGLCRGTRCRISAGHVEGALASVRIGTFLHPTVMFAFADSAGFLQHGDCPASQRSGGLSSFSDHSESQSLLRDVNPCATGSFRAAITGLGFGIAGSAAVVRNGAKFTCESSRMSAGIVRAVGGTARRTDANPIQPWRDVTAFPYPAPGLFGVALRRIVLSL